jgi:hypothetical protein
MNKSKLMFVLLLIVVNLLGCGKAAQTSQESTFKANFSLNSVVEKNKQFLLEDARHSSGAESGFEEPFLQSHEEMIVQLDPNKVPEFMTAVRSDIKQALIDSDAQILGSESGSNDTEHFSFSYSENETKGTIHVWGIPSEVTNFTLIALITES